MCLYKKSIHHTFLIITEFNPNALFVRTEHGGHLGYFEGGLVRPKDVAWIDRLLVEYADACVELSSDHKLDFSCD